MPEKTQRPSGVAEALSKPRFWRTPRVPPAFGRNASGTGRSRSRRPSRLNSRTQGSISRFAKPSDVITSVRRPVSARPSGSRLWAGNGCPAVGERRHVEDLDSSARAPVDADPERVEPRGVDLARVVREGVEDLSSGVERDAREAAELGALELRSGRDDVLAEELELRRAGAEVGPGQTGCGSRDRQRDDEQTRELRPSEIHGDLQSGSGGPEPMSPQQEAGAERVVRVELEDVARPVR